MQDILAFGADDNRLVPRDLDLKRQRRPRRVFDRDPEILLSEGGARLGVQAGFTSALNGPYSLILCTAPTVARRTSGSRSSPIGSKRVKSRSSEKRYPWKKHLRRAVPPLKARVRSSSGTPWMPGNR